MKQIFESHHTGDDWYERAVVSFETGEITIEGSYFTDLVEDFNKRGEGAYALAEAFEDITCNSEMLFMYTDEIKLTGFRNEQFVVFFEGGITDYGNFYYFGEKAIVFKGTYDDLAEELIANKGKITLQVVELPEVRIFYVEENNNKYLVVMVDNTVKTVLLRLSYGFQSVLAIYNSNLKLGMDIYDFYNTVEDFVEVT